MPPTERLRARAWLQGAALVALVLAVYAPTLHNGYVSDDEIYIRGIRPLASLAGLRDIWLRVGTVPQYYPLVHTAFWLEYHVWGLDPRGFHAMNVVSHAAVVLLAWRLLRRLAVPGAWLAAAIFAVHPVQVETVAWASERKNLLSALFAFGSIHAYLRFAPLDPDAPSLAPPRARRLYALSLLLYIAALLCKTVAVTTPAVLLVLRWWKAPPLTRKDLLLLLPFVGLGLPISLLTIWVERVHVGASGAPWQLGWLDRVLIAGRAVCFYLGKLAWPHPLGFVYPRWDVDPGAVWQYAYPAALVGLAVAFFALRRRLGRGPLAALLIFVGILFPAIGFFDVYPHLFSFVADHYQYHASLAPIALAAAAAAIGSARLSRPARAAAGVAAIAVLAALALTAQRETLAYRDDATLIRRTAANQPASWAARYRMGTLLQDESRHDEALAELREAERLFPAYAPTRVAMATSLVELGRLDEAAAELEGVLGGELDDDHDRAAVHLQLGNVRIRQGRLDAAAEQFAAAAALAPDSAEAQYDFGLVLRQRGDRPAAVTALRRAVALDPGVAKSQLALGTLLLETGDAAGAREALQAAVRLTPESADARERLGVALLEIGELDDAEAELRRSVALDPQRAGSHNLLGLLLERRAETDAAIAEFRQALAIQPDDPGAAANLARALGAARR
ncbi:MAG TPA: tetratricopeptide repeat protein [Myxococcota bacterium]|nr:tetratricopeptide repeat protein [Myxococcota bacterium]